MHFLQVFRFRIYLFKLNYELCNFEKKKKDFRRKFASRIESQIKIDQNYELYKCINTLYYDFFLCRLEIQSRLCLWKSNLNEINFTRVYKY